MPPPHFNNPLSYPIATTPPELAGDLYERYEEDDEENTEAFAAKYGMDFDDVSNLKLSYIGTICLTILLPHRTSLLT